jgi:cobalt/nickel transport system permease protein
MQHIRTNIGVLVTLLIRSYEQSDRVYSAMQLRGFDGSFHSLEEFTGSAWDTLKTVLVLSAGAAVIALELLHR